MTKVAFRAALLLFLAAGGCGDGGLDQPTSPQPALTLNVRLTAPAPHGTTEIAVTLAEVPYCPVSYFSTITDVTRPPAIESEGDVRPFDPSASTVRLSAASRGMPRVFGCRPYGVPLVRFFQPELYLLPAPMNTGPARPWTTDDTIVAYVDEPVTFTSFGPNDDPIALRPGYTVLKRHCGTTSPWQLAVDAADEPIDFHPPASAFTPQPLPPIATLLEQSERALLKGCGLEQPPIEAGKRVTFGPTKSLALRSGDTELIFLQPIDPLDPAQGAPLRSVNLVDGTLRQLAVVEGGRSIQTTDSGDIYVSTDTKMLRAELQPDGSALMTELPIMGVGKVSPDGRWIFYPEFLPSSATQESSVTVRVWEVGTGRSYGLPNELWPVGWSPTSLLLVVELGQWGSTAVLSPTDGQVLDRFYSTVSGFNVVWGQDGPVQLGTSTYWVTQLATTPPPPGVFHGQETKEFGLLLENLRGGGAATVLGVEAGLIIPAASADGVAFVWTRTCLGLFETACSFALHRVTVPQGEDQIVAVSDSAGLVSVAASGHRLAIGTRDGIYIRDLP